MTQEINNVLDKKYNYTYDAGGNILTKKVTDMTTGQVTERYGYGYDGTFKDRLISYGDETISGYDLQGRPNTYRGLSLTWTNGRVSQFGKNGLTQNCTYNANGIRTEKTVNGETHKYYLEDNKIVREVVTGTNNYELWYMYGASGIVGFMYKTASGSTNYYYRKNRQGDIVEIYDESGALYAAYGYDAWGRFTIFTNVEDIANINPFRYRGYYFDNETGLYYLNSRYYDSEIGRFISPDSIDYLAPENINGLNLYIYCKNNPIRYIDKYAHDPEKNDFNVTDAFGILETIFAIATGVMYSMAKMANRQDVLSVVLKMSSGTSSFFKYLGYAGVAINTIANIVINVQNGVEIDRIISDIIVDIGVGISSIILTTGIGFMMGSYFPGIGNVVGAVAGVMVGVFMIVFDDCVTAIKDAFYIIVSEFFNGVTTVINDIGNFFNRLFSFIKI